MKRRNLCISIFGSLLILSLAYRFIPHSMATVLNLNEAVNRCEVIMNNTADKEPFTITGEELEKLYGTIDNTKIQYNGLYDSVIDGDCIYHLYFNSNKIHNGPVLLNEQGYLFWKGIRYKILDDSGETMTCPPNSTT